MGTVRAPPPATISPGHNAGSNSPHRVAEEGKMVTVAHIIYLGKNTAKIVCSTHLSEERSPPLLPRPPPGERGGGRRRGGRQHPARPAQRLHRPGGGRGPRGPGAGPAGAPGQPAHWAMTRAVNEHSRNFTVPGKGPF